MVGRGCWEREMVGRGCWEREMVGRGCWEREMVGGGVGRGRWLGGGGVGRGRWLGGGVGWLGGGGDEDWKGVKVKVRRECWEEVKVEGEGYWEGVKVGRE